MFDLQPTTMEELGPGRKTAHAGSSRLPLPCSNQALSRVWSEASPPKSTVCSHTHEHTHDSGQFLDLTCGEKGGGEKEKDPLTSQREKEREMDGKGKANKPVRQRSPSPSFPLFALSPRGGSLLDSDSDV